MAHQEQIEFCQQVKRYYPEFFSDVFVMDAGSLDINGNNQYLFDDCHYLGVDIGEGRNVDIIQKIHELKFPDQTFDTIISTEVFEHDMFYEESIKNIYRMLKPGGLFLFTCATTGRKEHGTNKSEPESAPLLQKEEEWKDYYKNLVEDDIQVIFQKDLNKYFYKYQFLVNEQSHDLYFWGIKNGIYSKRQDRSYQLQNQKTELLRTEIEELKKISDLAHCDEIFYLQKYPDIKNYQGNPRQHYFEYGKYEQRIPNAFCERYHIPTVDLIGMDETIFHLEKKVHLLITELEIEKNRNAALEQSNWENIKELEGLNESKQVLESELRTLTETTTAQISELAELLEGARNEYIDAVALNQVLQEQNVSAESRIQELEVLRSGLENQLSLKEEELEGLNESKQVLESELEGEISDLLKDFANVKDKKESEIALLNDQLTILSQEREEISIQVSSFKQQLFDNEKSFEKLKEQLNHAQNDLLSNDQLIGTMQTNEALLKNELMELREQYDRLEQTLKRLEESLSEAENVNGSMAQEIERKQRHIEMLNTQMDQVVEDLANIKESKCWIYTKPIRDLQKIFKEGQT